MAISITRTNNTFNNNHNLIIVLSSSNNENYKIKSVFKDNYVFIYENDVLVGINVFDYKNEFENINEGYHDFSTDNFNKIVEKFPEQMNGVKNNKFIVIGTIEKIVIHPKNDKLKILNIKTDKLNLQIITNVQNVKINNNYLFIINGGFSSTGIIIENSKIMGVESQGMICSYNSIGINKDGIVDVNDLKITDKYKF